jgi:hypothetical protein
MKAEVDASAFALSLTHREPPSVPDIVLLMVVLMRCNRTQWKTAMPPPHLALLQPDNVE